MEKIIFTKRDSYDLLVDILFYLRSLNYSFDEIYEDLSVSDLIEELMQDYMK